MEEKKQKQAMKVKFEIKKTKIEKKITSPAMKRSRSVVDIIKNMAVQ